MKRLLMTVPRPSRRLSPDTSALAALGVSAGLLLTALVIAREDAIMRATLTALACGTVGGVALMRRIPAAITGSLGAVTSGVWLFHDGTHRNLAAADAVAWSLLLAVAILVASLGVEWLLRTRHDVHEVAPTRPLPTVRMQEGDAWDAPASLLPSGCTQPAACIPVAPRAAVIPVTPPRHPEPVGAVTGPQVIIARTAHDVPTARASATPQPRRLDSTDLPMVVGRHTPQPHVFPVQTGPYAQAMGGMDALAPERTDAGTLRAEHPLREAAVVMERALRPTPGKLVPLSTGRLTFELEFDRARLARAPLALLVISTAGVPGARPLPYHPGEAGPWAQAALSEQVVHDRVPPAALSAIVDAVTGSLHASATAFVITPDELGVILPGVTAEDGWQVRATVVQRIEAALAEVALCTYSEPIAVRSSMVFADDETPSARHLLHDARAWLHLDWDRDWLA